jgi:tRNA (guanine37-N1)-methyltransferase
MIKFDIITLFPEVITKHLEYLPFRKAISEQKIEVNVINLRDYAIDKRGTVDDKPYGGGTGMILRIEPIYDALKTLNLSDARVVVTTPSGKRWKQNLAVEFSKEQHIVIICGRYEGIDARVEENLATDKISIGDYVLSGGELPALIMMESITRLIPGVLEKESALSEESFNDENLEYPQYTRPEDFNGWKVPETLLSGNHAQIKKWRDSKKIISQKD